MCIYTHKYTYKYIICTSSQDAYMCVHACIYVCTYTHTALHKHRLTLVSRNNHQQDNANLLLHQASPELASTQLIFTLSPKPSCDKCSLLFHTGIKKAPRSSATWVTTRSQGKQYVNTLLRCHVTLGLGPESIQ